MGHFVLPEVFLIPCNHYDIENKSVPAVIFGKVERRCLKRPVMVWDTYRSHV
jgi:hypothetical protein